jgi:hypothetical protein
MLRRIFVLFIILIVGDAMSVEYPDAFDEVSEKYDVSGFKSLSEKELIIFTVWWLEAEVNNGGFHQYFWNSAGDHANQTLSALEQVGAVKTAGLLKSAMDIAFEGYAPEERAVRQNLLAKDEENKEEKLGELDSKFYEYKDDFYKLINVYIAN